MVEFADEKQKASRIHWTDADVEAPEARPRLILHRSNSNISINSVHSRRGSIDPASALPIQYRTVSYQIAESKEKNVAEIQKAKDSAAKGMRTQSIFYPSAYTILEFENLDWHVIDPNEIYTRLSTAPQQGLSSEQAKRRLTEYGKNTPSPPPTHYFQKIFGYFFKGFGSILLVGSILVFVSWKPLGEPASQANLALAIVLLAVFFIQAAFNAWQDWSSSRVMASITTMLPDSCLLLRDGAQVTVIASEIVPGDFLFIKAGNKLPADVRFIEVSSDAKFDRSILTGKFVKKYIFSPRLTYVQASPHHCQAQSIVPTTTISKQDPLVFKVHIVFQGVESELSCRRAILQSLERLQR
jgi:sodium/potassium-transporting ATPase subunit alpha